MSESGRPNRRAAAAPEAFARTRTPAASPVGVEPAERALAEHLLPGLDEPERSLVAGRYGLRPQPVADLARVLGRTPAELDALDRVLRARAATRILPYHEELICEPAVLVGATTPGARQAALADHVRTCRTCRIALDGRLDAVLAAVAAALPAPPTAAEGPPRGRLARLRRRGLGRRSGLDG